jgi:hypothetical protein
MAFALRFLTEKRVRKDCEPLFEDRKYMGIKETLVSLLLSAGYDLEPQVFSTFPLISLDSRQTPFSGVSPASNCNLQCVNRISIEPAVYKNF